MRYYGWLLVVCLLQPQSALAMEYFGSFLYWQATEPVDWVLDTNRNAADQFVAYETIGFNAAPGFRFGVARKGTWNTELYFTRLKSSSADSATGYLTPAFLGGKLALSDEPKSTLPYFDSGYVETVIDYNVLDWDFGRSFQQCESLRLRPVIGLKAAWIRQTFDSGFQGVWPDDDLAKIMTEHMKNNFWGLGPKIGIQNAWDVWGGEQCEVVCIADFYTAYLLGHWTVRDETHLTSLQNSTVDQSTRVFPSDARDFGAVTFQAMIGIELKYGCWSVTTGYEIHDWLNQCQIFDDATGPHNNDLVLQGLTLNVKCTF
jgi:hypothetical protein